MTRAARAGGRRHHRSRGSRRGARRRRRRPDFTVPAWLRVSACAGVILAPNPGPSPATAPTPWILSAPARPAPDWASTRPAGAGEWPGQHRRRGPGPLDEDHCAGRGRHRPGGADPGDAPPRDHADGVDRPHEITAPGARRPAQVLPGQRASPCGRVACWPRAWGIRVLATRATPRLRLAPAAPRAGRPSSPADAVWAAAP
ncbi:hypothetical protein QJS66_17135 [Kocuria rhizophila]|nr:hypothetical protein QJS66_17135 [Kocuria rhizophila]